MNYRSTTRTERSAYLRKTIDILGRAGTRPGMEFETPGGSYYKQIKIIQL